jgi:hypothetical protein
MSDEADRADDIIERKQAEGLEQARLGNAMQALREERYKGPCFCGEVMGKRFCGPECRDDFEREQRAKSRRL